MNPRAEAYNGAHAFDLPTCFPTKERTYDDYLSGGLFSFRSADVSFTGVSRQTLLYRILNGGREADGWTDSPLLDHTHRSPFWPKISFLFMTHNNSGAITEDVIIHFTAEWLFSPVLSHWAGERSWKWTCHWQKWRKWDAEVINFYPSPGLGICLWRKDGLALLSDWQAQWKGKLTEENKGIVVVHYSGVPLMRYQDVAQFLPRERWQWLQLGPWWRWRGFSWWMDGLCYWIRSGWSWLSSSQKGSGSSPSIMSSIRLQEVVHDDSYIKIIWTCYQDLGLACGFLWILVFQVSSSHVSLGCR